MKFLATLALLGVAIAADQNAAERACLVTLGMNDEDFKHLNMRSSTMQNDFKGCLNGAPAPTVSRRVAVVSDADKRA